MEKSQATKQFEVNTEGSCFMCFKEITSRRKSMEGSSDDDSDTEDDVDGGGNKTRRRNSENLSSLRRISRYLDLNMEKVFNSESTSSIPVQLLSTLQSVELKVSLCGECQSAVDKFSVTMDELDKIRLKMSWCCQTILKKLETAEGKAKEGYWERTKDNLQAVMHISIVEKLRKETIDKCTSKVDQSLPKVNLWRLSEESLSKATRNAASATVLKKTAKLKADDPVSPMATRNKRKAPNKKRSVSDIEYDDTPVSPMKTRNKSKAAARRRSSASDMEKVERSPILTRNAPVKRVRRVIVSSSSSSSSSSSDSDDEIVEVESVTDASFKNLDSFIDELIVSASARRDSETGFEAATASDINIQPRLRESSTSIKVDKNDDPVKRLYPFKCQSCRKRFKTEDQMNKHEHISASVSNSGTDSDDSDTPISEPLLKSTAPPRKIPVMDIEPPTPLHPMEIDSDNSVEVVDELSVISPFPQDSNNKIRVKSSLDSAEQTTAQQSRKKKSRKDSSHFPGKSDLAKKAVNTPLQQSQNRNSLKKKSIANSTNNGQTGYKFKCSQCSLKFKSDKQLKHHWTSHHAAQLKMSIDDDGDLSIIAEAQPSVPVLKPEDNFKIEYILPNNDCDEEMRIVDVTSDVDLNLNVSITESTNQFIDKLLNVSPDSTTTPEDDRGVRNDNENNDAVTDPGTDETVEQNQEVPSECLKIETYSTVANKKDDWTNITSEFLTAFSDEEMETDERQYADKIQLCIMNGEIKEELILTEEDEVLEVNKNLPTSLVTPPLQIQVVNCVQPDRES